MIPGMNPKQMQGMMKKMGIQQVTVPATEVIIRTADKEIIITEPQVTKVNMMGQQTYQIVGESFERSKEIAFECTNEDIDTIVEQTGASKEDAKRVLLEKKDIAEAIIALSE